MTLHQPEWFPMVRNILEVLFFLANIALACIAAVGLRQIKIGLEQLKLTKEIEDTNSKRESVKLAAELCKYYGHEVIIAQNAAARKYAAEKCTFLAVNPQPIPAFVLKDGDFKQVNYDINRVHPEWPKVIIEFVTFLNKAESFAIPFAEGVADDRIGFQETAASFISSIGIFMPAIYYLRMTQNVRYASVLKLWNIWHDRQVAKAITPEVMKGIQDLIAAAERSKIKPI